MKLLALISCLFLFSNQAISYQGNNSLNNSDAPDGLKTDDLAILGKVWGYLKYYHPTIAQGGINWDEELIALVPQIIQVKNANERNTTLLNWIKRFEITTNETNKQLKSGAEKLSPDFSWINHTDLGKTLADQLRKIQSVERSSSHHNIEFAPNIGNPLFTNEGTYSDKAYPDTAIRLLALYRYWNMIQYYFPYRHLMDTDWNKVLSLSIPRFLAAGNPLEYKLAVLSLIAQVQDTHAIILNSDAALFQYYGRYFAPIEIIFIKGKAVVSDYFDQELGLQSGLKKGDIIDSINGVSVASIIKERLPITSGSNYVTQLREIAKGLLRTNDSLLQVAYTRDNGKGNTIINCFSAQKAKVYSKFQRKDTSFKLIRPNIGYLYPGTIKNQHLPHILPEIDKTKGLIIDLRCYPSDFIVFSLGAHLMPQATPFAKFSIPDPAIPGRFIMTQPITVGQHNPDYYKGKVIILINELTQSQAEYTTMAFRVAPNAVVIGSTTAGADGNVSQIVLPGGIKTMISGIGVYYPDGRETQRVGIVPDLVVQPTIKGIKEGRDEVLEKAIELIQKQ